MRRLALLLRALLMVPVDLLRMVLIYLPGGSGVLLRRAYYARRLRKCGRNLSILPGVHITGAHLIEVGDNVMIRENAIITTTAPAAHERRSVVRVGPPPGDMEGVIAIGSGSRIAYGAVLLGYGGIRIGEKCGIGPGAIILSESYHYKGHDPAVVYKYSQGAAPEEQCVVRGLVDLHDGAGVASGVVVLPGARIGADSWVQPGSVVRAGARLPPLVIAKGDPATVVMQREAPVQ